MVAYGPQAVLASYRAAGDLSAKQFTFVKLDSNGDVVAVTAITDVAVGVLQNAPASGETAEVLVVGGTKLVASASITLPAVLGTDTSGRAKKLTVGTDITQYIFGQAEVASGGTGEVISAYVNCANVGRAA